MGFGLLFIGYFFLLSLPYNGIDILPDIIGFVLMYLALRKLNFYCRDNRHFKYARITTIPCAVLSLALLAVAITNFFAELPSALHTILQTAYAVAIGIYELFLLLGIFRLAKEIELPKLAARAQRMLTLTAVYYLSELLIMSGVLSDYLTSIDPTITNYLSFALYLLGYIWMLCTLALIFTCYMRICLEGDEEMPYREDLFDKLLAMLKGGK